LFEGHWFKGSLFKGSLGLGSCHRRLVRMERKRSTDWKVQKEEDCANRRRGGGTGLVTERLEVSQISAGEVRQKINTYVDGHGLLAYSSVGCVTSQGRQGRSGMILYR